MQTAQSGCERCERFGPRTEKTIPKMGKNVPPLLLAFLSFRFGLQSHRPQHIQTGSQPDPNRISTGSQPDPDLYRHRSGVPADHKDLLTTHLNTENGDTSAKKWRCHHHYQAITHLNTENGHIPKTDIRLTIFRLTARSGSISGRDSSILVHFGQDRPHFLDAQALAAHRGRLVLLCAQALGHHVYKLRV